MGKKIICCIGLLVFIGSIVFSQVATAVKGRGYQGHIFDSPHAILKSIKEQKNRYTPSKEDVNKAEMILNKLISKSYDRSQQYDDCPRVDKKLKKYIRQYFGFINKAGHKVIWVNLLWDKSLVDKAKEELITVYDGCSYYWNVEIDITNRELANLTINGKG